MRERNEALGAAPLRLVLADDHQVVRRGFRTLLEYEGLEVVGEAADGTEALYLAQLHLPDVVVMDFAMPRLNGIEAARAILHALPGTRIVLLTIHDEDYQVVAALRAGIRGYVIKTQAAEELVRAIHEVADGGVYLTPRVSAILVGAYLAGAVTGNE